MKKNILIAICVMLSAAAFASGVFPADSPQGGTLSFTASTGGRVTNWFSPAFSTVPVMKFTMSASTAEPMTNTVTSSYFICGVNVTNVSVKWSAYIGYPRMQYGTNLTSAYTSITNTFNPVYGYAPSVTLTGTSLGSSNATPILAAVTTTNFIYTIPVDCTNQIVRWISIGPAYSPGTQNVTY